MHVLFHLPALLAQDGSVQKSLSFDPSFSAWLLVPGMLLVVGLIVVLYRAQRQIASSRLVSLLTGIRVALLVLLFVMLLRPLWVWKQTQRTPETLWLLVDQSLSMGQADDQVNPRERLRWADALGMLPKSMQGVSLDPSIAALAALHDDLLNLQHQTTLPANPTTAAAEQAEFVRGLNAWNTQLRAAIDVLQRSTELKSGDGPAILKDLDDAHRLASDGAAQAVGRSAPDQSSDDLPWSRLATTLDTATARLRTIADRADDEFLKQHTKDASINAALNKVASLRRSDLAYGVLSREPGSVGQVGQSVLDVLNHLRTRIVAFGDGQRIVPDLKKNSIASTLKTALEPAGAATDLADALRFANDQIADGENASVLVVSDGRVNVGGDPADPARRLAARGVRVFTLAVGSRQVAPDAALESIDAPDWIYKDDTLRASAVVRLDALASKPVTVEFRRNGTLVDSKTITPTADQLVQTIQFTDKPPDAAVYSYKARILPVAGEAVADNNAQTARVAVKKDKLQVLIVEDQPRWEYRYLANYLKRDHRVHLQTVLLEPARIDRVAPPPPVKASPTNEEDDAQVLPQSAREWSAFDLIVLGDIPPEYLTPEAQSQIGQAVKDRGATLAVIAGPLNMPARYASSPLAEMLPVQMSSNWSGAELSEQLVKGFRPTVAPEGISSILSQFAADDATNARLWGDAPPWYWHSEQTQAKTSANVIWQIADAHRATQESDGDPLLAARQRALLATMPLGVGHVMYLASDSTWRLRQVGGTNLHERFWGQVVRWVAGSDMPAGGRFVRFGTDKAKYVAGESVHVSARILSQDFAPLPNQKFDVIARSPDGKSVGSARLEDSPRSPGLYQADLKNLPAGPIELALRGTSVEQLLNADPTATQKTLQIDVQSQASVEHQNVNADPATLARVAREGNGIALDGPDADVLAAHLPNVERELTETQQFGLFADPAARYTRIAHWSFLALFVTLITAEWLLRKSGGLV